MCVGHCNGLHIGFHVSDVFLLEFLHFTSSGISKTLGSPQTMPWAHYCTSALGTTVPLLHKFLAYFWTILIESCLLYCMMFQCPQTTWHFSRCPMFVQLSWRPFLTYLPRTTCSSSKTTQATTLACFLKSTWLLRSCLLPFTVMLRAGFQGLESARSLWGPALRWLWPVKEDASSQHLGRRDTGGV